MEIKDQKMNRCSKRMPCPLCGRPKFCMVSDNGQIILCTKVESKRLLKEGFGWIHYTNSLPKEKRRFKVVKTKVHKPDSHKMIRLYNNLEFAEFKMKKLAKKWDISTQALMFLGVGYKYDPEFRQGKWYFPMRDEERKLVGVQSRSLMSHSFCCSGSRMGVYIPCTFRVDKPTVIFEGFSDTATGVNLDLNCIGRASSNTGQEIISKLLKDSPGSLVIGDNDTKESHYAGQNGACDLSKLLPESKWWVPKLQNDFREFVAAGAFKPERFVRFLRKGI